MSERISPILAAASAQALTLVSREFRARQEAVDRTPVRAASQPQPLLQFQPADRLTQTNKPASNLVIPAIDPPPPRTELVIRANDLNQRAEELDGLVSDKGVSALQRTVLMSRATDLKRQVKELDNIVTNFFQEDLEKDRDLNRQPPVEPAAFFTSSLFRSSPAQQQPTAGALRAFARNSAAPAAGAEPPAQSAASQVDLLA